VLGERYYGFIDWTKVDKGLEVQAHFHPARSYVYNDRIVDPFLLSHELCHFRITEIFARRFRQQLSEINDMPSDDLVNEIFENNEALANDMQHRYDEETYHGYVMMKQKRWERNVDSLLNLLIEYKTPIVTYD